MNRDIKRITLLILLSLFVVKSYAASNTSDRINAVAQFLIDRAHDNYLYIFEENIKKSDSMDCYFPATLQNLKFAGLKQLLLSKQIWETSISNDFETLLSRAAARKIGDSYDFSRFAATARDKYIVLLQQLQLKHNDKPYDLTILPFPKNEAVNKKINAFYKAYSLNSDAIESSIKFFKLFEGKKLCETPVISSDELERHVKTILSLKDNLEAVKQAFREHRDVLVLKNKNGPLNNKNEIEAYVESLLKVVINDADKRNRFFDKESIRQAIQLEKNLTSLKELLNAFKDKEASHTDKAIKTLIEIEKYAEDSEEEFAKLKKYVLFFAQVSDADKDGVTAILKAHILPSVSFYEKRNKKNVWLIGAYLGVVGGSSEVPAGEDDGNNFGIFAPVGLEYSNGNKNSGSWSVMLAPFDFGYPVSLKLNGIDKDVNLDDIVAPAIVFSYGVPDLPLSIGLGYQRGRSFIATSDNEEKIFIHFSFDMPLWVF